MPLSEHEQRMLDQMEKALSQEDPKFASQMRTPRNPRSGRLMLAAGGMLLGLGVAVLGVMNQLIWLGVVGFVIMVAVATWAFSGSGEQETTLGSVQQDGTVRPVSRPKRGRRPSTPSRTASGGSFMQRMEERWERRRREQW